jgi:hypothetical protein
MKIGTMVGTIVLVASVAALPRVEAQEAAKPDISLTLTETLNSIAPSPSSRDDLREIPPPPRNDKLRDSVRVTVIVDSPECLPGEDLGIVPPAARRPLRAR